MDKVTFKINEDLITGEIIETALIDLGDGNFISMLKSTYDEQQAKLTTQP